jgi:hypothetical protein
LLGQTSLARGLDRSHVEVNVIGSVDVQVQVNVNVG